MRIFSALFLSLVCTGCSSGAEQTQASPGAERIDCALGDGAEFAPDCLVERTELNGDRVLTVRHPDGGFRRFDQVNDGRGLDIADGADEVKLTLAGDVLEVAVAEDRYRFPAVPTQGPAEKAGASD